MQYTYKVTARRVRSSVVAWKSNKYYICWVCVCSLRYPACNAHAPYSRCVACPLLHYLVHIMSQTAWVQWKKIIEHKMCVDFLYKFCPKYFIFWVEGSEIWPEVHTGLHVKCPSFLSYFIEIRNFFDKFSKKFQCQVLSKFVQWEPSCSISDGRRETDGLTCVTKVIVAFRSVANAPKTSHSPSSEYHKLETRNIDV